MNNRFRDFRTNAMTATTVTTVLDDSARSVLRNTYMLLSACLAFSALVAGASVLFQLPHPGLIITLVGYFGLLFLVTKYRTSGAGVAWTFALTGFMGYTLGPIVGHYLKLPQPGWPCLQYLL